MARNFFGAFFGWPKYTFLQNRKTFLVKSDLSKGRNQVIMGTYSDTDTSKHTGKSEIT